MRLSDGHAEKLVCVCGLRESCDEELGEVRGPFAENYLDGHRSEGLQDIDLSKKESAKKIVRCSSQIIVLNCTPHDVKIYSNFIIS